MVARAARGARARPEPARPRPGERSAALSVAAAFPLAHGRARQRMDLNPLRHLARHTPQPIQGIAATAGSVLDDSVNLLRHGIPPGDDLDQWDSEYIRHTAPLMRAL